MGLIYLTVYNCRTSNAWDLDLAFTATYFPHCGLTFAVLFGCPLSAEKEVLRRLTFAKADAAHPLLMPGIIAEIERARQVQIVETTIDELEARIFQLDFQSSDMEDFSESEAETQNQQKRSAWLNTTYLRNSLISWNTQLAKLRQHTDELNVEVFKSASVRSVPRRANIEVENDWVNTTMEEHKLNEMQSMNRFGVFDGPPDETMEHDSFEIDVERPDFKARDGNAVSQHRERHQRPIGRKDQEESKELLQRVGQKIKDRVQTIIDEYDEKIRDCTMRVDGMAMATQWASVFRNRSHLERG